MNWCQQMLHKYGLQMKITEEEAAALAGYTKSALASSILPYQIMIDPIKSKVKTTDTRAQNAKYRTISGK